MLCFTPELGAKFARRACASLSNWTLRAFCGPPRLFPKASHRMCWEDLPELAYLGSPRHALQIPSFVQPALCYIVSVKGCLVCPTRRLVRQFACTLDWAAALCLYTVQAMYRDSREQCDRGVQVALDKCVLATEEQRAAAFDSEFSARSGNMARQCHRHALAVMGKHRATRLRPRV